MKKIFYGISGVMMISLIIALVFYQYSLVLAPQKENKVTKDSEPQTNQKEQPLYAEHTVDYSLQNDELKITFDKGNSWLPVPIIKDQLFEGEYSGNKQEPIENSYILLKNRTAFLYSDGPDGSDNKIYLTYTLDQGKLWRDAVIAEHYPSLRFRKVNFLNDNFGYCLLSGDRTVSQEMSNVYLTHDGGKSWRETNPSNVTNLVKDGGFVDEQTGFLSYGFINPEEPDLYVTQDEGNSWMKATINIPDQYHKIFVTAELPFKEKDHLAVLINQGPNGDYKGGKVKGKFLSNDNGKTWGFSTEVKPNETEQGETLANSQK
ncbi:WD40/YVTN/BNR-like repeat-containing protein [Neobacillus soli]|uniref:WD40/YVTN/BNR-like repeat-containing protein n=1 Tax=Neobacillus soli TaxID=220688 RepID=UPI000826E090|nr:oxidoreductase [Neobacillus soli]